MEFPFFAEGAAWAASIGQTVWALRWVLGAVLVMGLAGWGAAAVWWRRQAEAELADRARVTVVPASTFDPGEAEVLQQGARLRRVREAAGTVPRRAGAVRLQLVRGQDGQVEYRMCGSQRAAAVLAVPHFADVQVHDMAAAADQTPARVRLTEPRAATPGEREEPVR